MIVAVRASVLCLLVIVGATGCDVRVGDDGVSVGVASGRADDEWVRTYMLPEGGALEIVNMNGSIEVAGAPGPSLDVHIYREARAGSDEAAQAVLQSLRVMEDVEAGRVAVAVRRLPDAPALGRRERVTARFHVRVPPGLTTVFRTQNGQIRVEYVSGRITVATSNGGINASGVSGGLSASVGNGSARLDFVSVDHPTDVTVLNGGIRVELPADVRANVEASALNGRITVDEVFDLEAKSDGGFGTTSRVAGALNGGGPAITLQTTNGAVRIVARGADTGAASGR